MSSTFRYNYYHSKYIVNNRSIAKFKQNVSQNNWNDLPNDPSQAYQIFLNRIKEAAVQSFTGVSKSSATHSFKIPWLNYNLSRLCKKKNALYKTINQQINDPTITKNQKEESYKSYKIFRNKLNSLLRTSKQEYLKSCLMTAQNDIKKHGKF